MANIVKFITGHAAWFYLLCALGIVILLSIFLRARRGAKQSLFGLELEVAVTRQKRALRLMLLTTLLAAVVLLVATVVEPNLPADQRAAPTPTPDIFLTPPPTFTNQTPTATATLTTTLTITQPQAIETLQLSVTPGSEEAEEFTPTPPPAPAPPVDATCAITSPANGSSVNGEVTFWGTATSEQFMFYKLEAYGPETAGAWASILGDVVSTPVVNGALGTTSFDGWTPGSYSIRLVIVDTTSNEVAGCFVSLNVTSP